MTNSKIKLLNLSPLLKWAGGKEQELKYIIPALPENFNNYYEPFVGGGAVYFSLPANKYFINDKSEELIGLYKILTSKDKKDFFKVLDEVIHNLDILGNIVLKRNNDFFINLYKNYSNNKTNEKELKNKIFEFVLSHTDEFNGMFETTFNYDIENFIKELNRNLLSKIKRMKVIESQKGKLPEKDILDNIETALKSAFYMHFRFLYNNKIKYNLPHAYKIAIFLFIRNYAYSGMFRYNGKGEFNVPYGGIGYNNKNFSKKLDYLKSKELEVHLKNTIIENNDFEDFFKNNEPKKDDFIFLDPPYDSEFSTYDKNIFNKEDQKRLANYLIKDCKAKWMMIIKNTDFIFDLYNDKNLNIQTFDKKYLVSFMNRNDKDVKHLLITNY
ncbi:MAG: DNA adenine methylase [Candidatus Gracilibacteria bacterium]|nr:DNA adenine methylase [Candidatus Gracilibacteria bacterium]